MMQINLQTLMSKEELTSDNENNTQLHNVLFIQ